jgi:hypothetical protein
VAAMAVLATASPHLVFDISPRVKAFERVTNPFEIASTRFAVVIVAIVKNYLKYGSLPGQGYRRGMICTPLDFS